jgi:hypothetical protein
MRNDLHIRPILSQFDLHNILYNNVLAGFTDEETNRRLYGDTKLNHIKYLAGHLLNSQYGFGFLAGVRLDVKWDEMFAAMGRSEARDDITYPAIEEIKAEWNSIYEPSRSALTQLTVEEISKTPPKPVDKVFENSPVFDNTIAGFLTFLNHHQAYHIGQIGILRRGFGKEPMSYQ